MTAQDKVYDATVDATLDGGSLGVLANDSVILTAGSGSLDNKNVGSNKAVTATGFEITGTDSTNYVIAGQPDDLSADISQADLGIVGITVIDRFFDGTTSTILLGGELAGVIGNDDVNLTTGSGIFLDPNIGLSKPITISGFTITGADAGNYSLNQPRDVTGNILLLPSVLIADDYEDYTETVRQFLLADPAVYIKRISRYSEELWILLNQENDPDNPLTEDQKARLQELLSASFATASN